MMKKFITILFIISCFCPKILGQENTCSSTDMLGTSIIFSFKKTAPAGDSEFTIGENKKVVFLLGNLQYQPSTGTYRIANRQVDFVCGKFSGTKDAAHGLNLNYYGTVWEMIDGVRTRCTNDSIGSNTYKGWVDLFPFGTGDLHGTDIATGEEYRTPTEEEYRYLFETRDNARKLRGRARVVLPGKNSAPDTLVNGVILMPDNWDPSILPNNTFIPDSDGVNGCWYYWDNVYTLSEWYLLESYGAIFLPAAGTADGQTKYNRSGYYWTGTATNKGANGVSLEFGGFEYKNSSGIYINNVPTFQRSGNKSHRRAIRMCKEIVVE